LACGFFIGQPEEWLVLSLGLLALVAAPGFVVVHQARIT
jgi:hypothetical protein